jgi:hypothetical protein
MRLFSFLSLIETSIASASPELSRSWSRRANYHTGHALLWQTDRDLSLEIHDCELSNGRHSITARWCGSGEEELTRDNFYCQTAKEWSLAATAISDRFADAESAAAASSARLTPSPSDSLESRVDIA